MKLLVSNYSRFYDEVDRVNEYSCESNPQVHPFGNVLKSIIDTWGLNNEKALEIGSGNGRFQSIIDNYTGVDVSEKLSSFYEKPFIAINDGQKYPFGDEEFGLVFTNAVFEHIPDIDNAMSEMLRVTKTDGLIVFNPAWNCRPWAINGYQVRPYSDFGLLGKIYKASIPVLDSLLVKAISVFPRRVFLLSMYAFNKKLFEKHLWCRKLNANYETFWQSDSDACNRIDPCEAILYFKANNCEIVNYPIILKQFFMRTGELVVKKR